MFFFGDIIYSDDDYKHERPYFFIADIEPCELVSASSGEPHVRCFVLSALSDDGVPDELGPVPLGDVDHYEINDWVKA